MVDRAALFYRLQELKISSKFIAILRGLCRDKSSAVWLKGGLTNNFRTDNGVRQRCLFSPLLFTLFIYDISKDLGGGIKVGDTIINSLLYEDGIVILADDKVILQRMINNLKLYFGINVSGYY